MKRIFTALVLILFCVVAIYGQKTVTGTITDESGEALIGVSILAEGTTVGTVSDFDGNFSLNVPEGVENLVFSYTGYASQKISIESTNNIVLTMKSDVLKLEDIVVVGYAPMKRKDLTGSVSTISGEKAAAEANSTVQSAIRRASGVVVQQSSGAPGAGFNVRVRGATSISASNEPLFVIDGVPVVAESFLQIGIGGQETNALADINPEDIESMEVLKDASTTAIYGSRAANGVVLIRTKKGSIGKTKIDLNASYGMNELVKTVDVVDAATYREYLKLVYGTDQLPWVQDGADTDWQNLVFGSNPIQKYGANISGGDAKTKFYIGLNYDDNQGAQNGTRFTRYSTRLNLSHNVSEKFVTSMNIGFTRSNNKLIPNDNNIYGAFSTSILLPPSLPSFNDDGTYAGNPFGWNNPVAASEVYDHTIRSNRIIGNIEAKYFLTDNLSISAILGLDGNSNIESVFEPSILASSPGGTISEGANNFNRVINEYNITYNDQIGQTSFTAVAAAVFQRDDLRRNYFVTNDLPTDNFTGPTSAANPSSIRGERTGNVLNSYLLNVNLGFNDIAFLSASVRADGSSKFVNNKWGIFPGASAGINFSNMDFLKGGTFDLLKLRTSYGITGNNNIENFETRQLFGGGATYLTTPGISPTQIGNPDLVWETTAQFDVGLDMAFFSNRLGFTAEYYVKNTSDLILPRPIPTTTGFTSVPENIGDMKNTGIDLSATFLPFSGEFKWSSTLTASFLRNEVVKLYQGTPIDYGFATRLSEGQPTGSFYGHVTDGIFQNQSEVEAHADQPNAAPGDIRFKDLNGDGKINDDDRDFIGKALPDWVGGLDNTLSYKGLELNVFFQFSLGNSMFNNNGSFAEGVHGFFAPTQRIWENAWRQEGDGNEFPRIVNGDPNDNRRESDRFVEDASYARLKTAQLSYTFPEKMFGKLGIRSLKFYIQATNLITWTNYSWLDPEVSTFGDQNVALGTDFLTVPQSRTIQFGLNLGL